MRSQRFLLLLLGVGLQNMQEFRREEELPSLNKIPENNPFKGGLVNENLRIKPGQTAWEARFRK